MNSKSNLNSNSLSEVCKRKEEEDPAQTQNEKHNPAQTAKPQPAHGHPFLFSAPGPSHRPKPAQATQPAFSSLPSRIRPSSIFLGPPFFPHGPACPHLPLALQRALPPLTSDPGPACQRPSLDPAVPHAQRPALPPRAQPGRVTRAPLLSRGCPDAPAHLFRSLARTACSRSGVTPRLLADKTGPHSTRAPPRPAQLLFPFRVACSVRPSARPRSARSAYPARCARVAR